MPMKDVDGCDKPRRAAYLALTRALLKSKDFDGGQVRVYSKALVEENEEEMLKAG
jgi:hypothetical protein